MEVFKQVYNLIKKLKVRIISYYKLLYLFKELESDFLIWILIVEYSLSDNTADILIKKEFLVYYKIIIK